MNLQTKGKASPLVGLAVRQGELFLTLFLALGCEGDYSSTSNVADSGGSPPICSPTATGTGQATECAELSLCLSEAPHVEVNVANCPGCTWSWQRDTLGKDQLSYSGGSSVYMGFDGLTLGETSQELREKLYAVNVYVELPSAEAGVENWVSSQANLRSGEELDTLEMNLSDGILRVSLAFDANPVATLMSKTTICDDTSLCSCTFPGIESTSTIVIALPLPG